MPPRKIELVKFNGAVINRAHVSCVAKHSSGTVIYCGNCTLIVSGKPEDVIALIWPHSEIDNIDGDIQ